MDIEELICGGFTSPHKYGKWEEEIIQEKEQPRKSLRLRKRICKKCNSWEKSVERVDR